MLLTLTTTATPATDLGYLLGKNPARVQTFELAFGKAHVFYPEASEARCTAALLPCRGGEQFLRRLFEPLGYEVAARQHQLDDHGPSRYFTVTLTATKRLSDLLAHVYVLIPVLDDDKHYWVGDDEVEKLLRHGDGWLETHPEREAIASRYLAHQKSLARAALDRLSPLEAEEAPAAAQEVELERPLSLNDRRRVAVIAALEESGAARVLDLGCGEGKLLRAMLGVNQFKEIVGMDVSLRALEIVEEILKLARMPEKQRERIKLLHGSLLYRDDRLAGFDAAVVVEVVEHLDEPRLQSFERALFEFARPSTVVLTTPNAEYNVKFDGLPAGKFRHKDHRFEWTRAQFESWANRVAARFGYIARFAPIGPVDEQLGAPTQMAVFSR